ncbi:hypothetical protein CCYA_CCYA05G1450 [Cyanidiococcus yangmingshanensis]|nr:hypothetical protein CCYA_CCYA05G1450 [Cyanidiococcus yangmingshanensis]
MLKCFVRVLAWIGTWSLLLALCSAGQGNAHKQASGVDRLQSAKALHVRVVAGWDATSLPIEFLEGIRKGFSDQLFWKLLDQWAEEPTKTPSIAGEAGCGRAPIEWLRQHLEVALRVPVSADKHTEKRALFSAIESARRALEAQVAQRVYAGRVQLHTRLEAEDRLELNPTFTNVSDAWALLICGEERVLLSDLSMLAQLGNHLEACRTHVRCTSESLSRTMREWRRFWLPIDTALCDERVFGGYPESLWDAHQTGQACTGPAALAILYADVFHDASFGSFHRAFREHASTGDLVYILRYRSRAVVGAPTLPEATSCTGEMPLSGYTVEVALKSSEYLVLDARRNETLWMLNRSDPEKNAFAAFGLIPQDIQDLHRSELEKTLDVLLMREIWSAAMNPDSNLITNWGTLEDASGTLLSYIERLSNDLPSIGPVLFHEAKAQQMRTPSFAAAQKLLVESALNLSRLHAELEWSTLPSILYLNGRRVAPNSRSIAHCAATIGVANLAAHFLWFEFGPSIWGTDSFRQRSLHRLLIRNAGRESVSVGADMRLYIPEVLDCRLPGDDSENATDSTLLLVRLNDIERDRKYAHWNASFRALLPTADRGGLPTLRRNAFRLVAFVDPGSAVGLDIAVQLIRWVQNRHPLLPFQISVVFVPRLGDETKDASEISMPASLFKGWSAPASKLIAWSRRLRQRWRAALSETEASTSETVSVMVCRAVFYFQHVWRSRRATASFLSELHAIVQREHPLAGLLQLQVLMGSSNAFALPPMPPKPAQIQQAFMQTFRLMNRTSAERLRSMTSPERDFRVFVQGRPRWQKPPFALWDLVRLRRGDGDGDKATAPESVSGKTASQAIAETQRWIARIGLPEDTSATLVLNGKVVGDLTSGQGDAAAVLELLRSEVNRLAELVRSGLAPDERCADHIVYGLLRPEYRNTSATRRHTFIADRGISGTGFSKPLVRVPALEPQLLAMPPLTQTNSMLDQNGQAGGGANSLALLWDAFASTHRNRSDPGAHLLQLPYRYGCSCIDDNAQAELVVPTTVWFLLDLDSERGIRFLLDVLQLVECPEEHRGAPQELRPWPAAIRVALFHTGRETGLRARSILHSWAPASAANRSAPPVIDRALRERIETLCHQPLRNVDVSTTPASHLYSWNWLRLFYRTWSIGRRQQGLIVNGRLYRIDRNTLWEQHPAALVGAALEKEAARVAALLRPDDSQSGRSSTNQSEEIVWRRADAAMLATMITDVLDAQCKMPASPGKAAPDGLPLDLIDRVRTSLPAFHYHSGTTSASEDTGSFLKVQGIFAPFTAADSELVALLRRLLRETLNADLDLVLNPRLQWQGDDGRALQPRYTRTRLATSLEDAMVPAAHQSVVFDRLAEYRIHSVRVQTPPGWLIVTRDAEIDPDNIALAQWGAPETPLNRSITYELTRVLVEGHVLDEQSGSHPNGLGLELESGVWDIRSCQRQHQRACRVETLVMGSLGYFQLAVTPGVWRLTQAPEQISRRRYFSLRIAEAVIPSLPSSHSERNSTQNELEYAEHIDGVNRVIVESLDGLNLVLHTTREPNLPGMDVLTDLVERIPAVANLLRHIRMLASGELLQQPTSTRVNETGQIHIFSIASGHLYERLLRIMMLSAVRATPHYRCKFWLIGNFLSPTFRAQLPQFARRVGFDFELVFYAWPPWLRFQHDKQRLIWAYKILFLDVLFPPNLKRVIFIDSDQVVRGDLGELWQMPLKSGAVYGFVPFCEDRPEMDEYRFWKRGFWAKHLRGRPYHISALFVVDLQRFREQHAGDILRALYQRLSADPNSLANLDQDLPNYASMPLNDELVTQQAPEPMVPLHSLPSEWLWCESWCNEDSKPRAKTIDLCNNPNTRESKLESARRIIPHWDDLDAEATAAATLTHDRDWEQFRAQRGMTSTRNRHDELR